jgi:GGDEF domain-containing protein
VYSIDREGVVKPDGTEGKQINNQDEIIKDMSPASSKQNTIVIKQLNLHGKQVVDKMIKDNIPPTPANYAIYFEKIMEDKPQAQKQNISTVLELEEVEDFDYVLKIENNINEGFNNIKAMMDIISNVYTKINKLRAITKKRKEELAKGSSKLSLLSYDEDLSAITEVLTKQQNTLKEQYNNMTAIIKNFNNESIFDKKYDVYNKKYLFKIIDSERTNTQNFGYESTLLALKVKKSALENVRLTRDKELIIKTVGKMILKRSRRSDIIAHLQDGIFIIILKHTNIEQAQKTIASIENMISFSNYIVDSQTIDIELDFALSSINPTKTKEQIIAAALEKLPN